MNTKQTNTNQTQTTFTSEEVMKSQYIYRPQSRTSQFNSSTTSYRIAESGMIETKWDREYFN